MTFDPYQMTIFDALAPSTLSPEASPAKTSALPASGLDLAELVLGCGGKCGASLKPHSRLGCLLRTYLVSELKEATRYSYHWRNLGTPANRSWWVLGMSKPDISESEYGYSPTMYGYGNVDATGKVNGSCELDMAVKYPHLLKNGKVRLNAYDPTPTATGYGSNQGGSAGRKGQKKRPSLQAAIREYDPTPTVQDGENNAGPSQFRRNSYPLNVAVSLPPLSSPSTNGKLPGFLNPAWVCQYMGYPADWL